jgi:hypothetical protein
MLSREMSYKGRKEHCYESFIYQSIKLKYYKRQLIYFVNGKDKREGIFLNFYT